jgi:hypothetical protein
MVVEGGLDINAVERKANNDTDEVHSQIFNFCPINFTFW